MLFDAQKSELKEYIDGRTGYREKLKKANFTDGYNKNSKEKNSRKIRHDSKIAEGDFFRDLDVKARQAETFTENSLSFLRALNEESNRRKLRKDECKQGYKLKNEKHGTLTGKKWKAMLASPNEKLVEEQGITLLALILTVVIMLILAAVTINVTLGDGGLVDQAKHAAEATVNSSKTEQINVTLGDGGLVDQAKHAAEATVNSSKTEQEQMDELASQLNEIIAGVGGGTGGGVTNSTPGGETNTVPGEDTNSIDTNSVGGDTNTVDTNTIDPDPEPPEPLPDGTISIGEPQWQPGGTANVTVSTTEDGVTIEYQIGGTDEGSWIQVTGGTIEGIQNGETVYVRITDGEQSSNPQSTTVSDTTAPEKANIEINPISVLVGENLTATVTHVDNETGVDIENSKWVLTQSETEIGIGEDVISQYTGSFTANPDTIDINTSTSGTYYLHILTVDKAGNKTETVSEAITISAITGIVTQNGQVTWDAGKATLVLQGSDSQYTIVYKINGQGSWQTYNGTSITGLSHGDKVTACLTNANQTTYGPEAEFEIQDTTNPTVTVTAQGSPSTNSITVTAQAVDNESGMVASPKYTFQIKQSGLGSYTTPSGAENISNATYTFTGLTQGTTYDIQVIVNGDNAGNTGTGTLTNQTTTTVPGADEGLQTGNITSSPVDWDNYKASTTLTTTTNFKIQYQVNGTSESGWSEATNSPVTVSNLDHSNTVYARLTDGTNAGDYAAINILDGTPPTVSVEVGEVTDTSIAVTVSATDNESGLADSNAYRYYLNEETEPRATSSSNTYKYESLTATTPYSIKVEVVDNGNNTGTGTAQTTTTAPAIPENTSYVGCYADVDRDGDVDGVIYADLAIGGSGRWSTYSYTIPTGDNFKKYSVVGTYTENKFGTNDIIQVSNKNGNERFYVMALSSIISGTHSTFYWYYNAYGNMNDYSRTTSTEFGTGKSNTEVMLTKWNGDTYGIQDSNDIWGIIQSQVENGWYIPSRGEWSAFANQLEITTSNYSSKALSDSYWSSSQTNANFAWSAGFTTGCMNYVHVGVNYYVRLGTTF